MSLLPYTQTLDLCPVPADDGRLAEACRALSDVVASGAMPCLSVARTRDDLPALEARAREIAEGADDVLLLGIGGSSLGARTLLALGSRGPRLHLVDNVDPETWAATLGGLDPRRTHVLAVSKSGSTVETMAQLVLAAEWRAAAGTPLDVASLTAITEPGERPLRAYVETRGGLVVDHDAEIGGRFSVLSPVGMLPALLAGRDAVAVRAGANEVLEDMIRKGPESAPARGAALAVALERQRGLSTHVLVAYADRLATFCRWYVQLWAESLGKDGRGSNPVAALGVTDQHSQLQLWIEGPRDKWLTVIGYPTAGDGPRFADTGGLDYLEGHTLGDLFEAEREATVESVAAAGVPVRTMTVRRLDERTLGGLFAHFMIETILAGRLMGVDPFGQPAVEDGKRRARARLAGRTA